MTMTVEPIYGNGWTDGHDSIQEPSRFTIDAQRTDKGKIVGRIIISEEASLKGAMFEATPRHAAIDSVFNCCIKIEKGAVLIGYCLIK